jgi:lincosamide nucleotidyltransferase A/C/D/E
VSHEMMLDDINWFLDLFDQLGITVWIDGGWDVDALLGEQTHRHADLDIMIPSADAAVLRNALGTRGFTDVHTDDHSDWNYVMGSGSGKLIDFHLIDVAKDGRGIYGSIENGNFVSVSALLGAGSIGGRAVRCLTAQYEVRSHTGYTLKDTDFSDVQSLHRRVGIPLPDEHKSFLP